MIQNLIDSVKKNKPLIFKLFIIFSILQSVFPIHAIARISPETQDGIVMSISTGRMMLILVILSLDFFGLITFFLIFKNEKLQNFTINKYGTRKIWDYCVLILICIIWLIFWLPPYRLGQLSEEYLILRPVIQWICVIGIELFLVLSLISSNRENEQKSRKINISIKQTLLALIPVLIFIGFFYFLQKNIPLTSGIIEPAAPPISPLQLFLLLTTIFFFYFSNLEKLFPPRTLLLITIFLLYGISATKFLATPLPCTGDLVGIHPPNHTCYPDIRDAVYPIGSLYTYYGEGIFNQWATDKPLYMFFLTVCQWISGIQFENYMTTQVLILSLLPVGIFLLVKNISDYSSALFASLLTILGYSNSILLYSKLGGVNIKLPLSEVLTAFMLVVSALSIYKMFTRRKELFWSLITGIVTGLAVLTRFNAVLIVPLLGLFILASNRKDMKFGIKKLLCFGAGIFIILLPWVVINPIIKGDMTSSYLDKIQHILRSRSDIQGPTKMIETASLVRASALISTENISLAYLSNVMASSKIQLTNSLTGLFEYSINILLHFANNLSTAFYSLPVNIRFENLDAITEQVFWTRDSLPIWQKPINPVNISILSLSVFLFIWGTWRSWKYFGFSGLSALIVFLGYLLGNSFALTSGGRYLVPAVWAIFIYFSIGLMDIIKSISKFLFGILEEKFLPEKNNTNIFKRIEKTLENFNIFTNRISFKYPVIAALLLLGFILPFLQILPDKLPPERTAKTDSMIYSYLKDDLDSESWETFLKEKDSFIVEGVLFFPQYFDQTESPIAKTTNVFEAMVMGKDYLYMSYMYNQMPEYITDGSRVLLLGCKIREGFRWGIRRRVVQAFSVIQIDHEGEMYIDPQASWTCGDKK